MADTDIERALSTLREGLAARFGSAASEQALRDENAKILGKKGELTAILSLLGKAAPESRKALGVKVNTVKQEVETGFASCLRELRQKEREAELSAPPFDLTLPGRSPVTAGHKHPIA